MRNIIRQIKNKRASKKIILPVLLVVLLGCFAAVSPAKADFWDGVNLILGAIAYAIGYFVGLLLTLVINVMVKVAQYNDIINVEAVKLGWTTVRDLCNMFFVLIFLVIAFATVLRIEQYSVTRLLPKLLIMAVLINFSRTICGLIIDFAQVIMLTFVSGFADQGEAEFVRMFQIQKYLEIADTNTANGTSGENIDSLATTAGIIAGVFAMIVTLIVMAVLTAILVMRVVMLWVYTILSPIAFLLSTFPAGQKYYSQWWSEFIKQVTVGPILAFFIWLALVTVSQSSGQISGTAEKISGSAANNTQFCGGINTLFCSDSFQTYIITLALLIGGLIITQQMGGFAGRMASGGMNWAKKSAFVGMGGRYLSERYKAFQGQRESARKQKASAAGERLYGLYSGAKTAVSSRTKAATSAGLATIGYRPVSEQKYIKKFNDWRANKRTERDDHRDSVSKALSSSDGRHEQNGFEYTRSADGKKVNIRNTTTGKSWDVSKAGHEFAQRYNRNMSPARNVQDGIAKKRIDEKINEFRNISTENKKQTLNDTSASMDERRAAAISLMKAEAFSNPEELQTAKSLLKNLPSLAKDFNESADKRFGMWNNMKKVKQADGSIGYELDEEKIKSKIADGTINITNLDTAQLKDSQKTVDLVAKISGVNFNDNLDKMTKTDVDRKNIEAGLGANIEKRDFSNENDMDIRRAYAGYSGNVREAMATKFKTDAKGNRVVEAYDREEAKNLISGAKGRHLAKIENSDFDDENFAKDFGQSVSAAQLDQAQKSGEADNTKMQLMVEMAVKHSDENNTTQAETLKGINKNNNLRSIIKDEKVLEAFEKKIKIIEARENPPKP